MFRQAMSCEILVQIFNDEASPNFVVDVLDHILKIIVGKLTSWVAVEFLIARFSSLGGVQPHYHNDLGAGSRSQRADDNIALSLASPLRSEFL